MRIELRTQIVPRGVLVLGVGIGGGTLLSLLQLSPMGFRSTVVAATFWTASFALLTFRRDVSRMLLWLLLLDATLTIYQTSIYSELEGPNVLVRVGPVLLGGLILSGVCLTRQRGQSKLPALWVALNTPALIPLAHSSIPVIDGVLFWGLSVLYPITFYLAASVIRRERWERDHLGAIIASAVVALCVVPLVLLPLELSERQTNDVSSLQVGGRSYATLGIVFLLAGLLLHMIRDASAKTRILSITAVVALFGLSFSRGALICGALLLIGILILGRRIRIRFFLGLAASSFLLLQAARRIYPSVVDNASHFWLLRTNIGSNTSDRKVFDLGQFLQTGRNEIWDFGIAAWESSFAWGHGIGSTPYMFREATNGAFSYSGMHNLMITVLAERGLFGALAVLLIFGRIAKLILASRGLSLTRPLLLFCLAVFLLFAQNTGVELFQNSTRAMNASLTVYLFLFVAFLESQRAARPRLAAEGALAGARTVHDR